MNINREKMKIHLKREKEKKYIDRKDCAKYKVISLHNFSHTLIGHI